MDRRRRPGVGYAVAGQPRRPEQLRDRARPLRRTPRPGGDRGDRRVGGGDRHRRGRAGGRRRAHRRRRAGAAAERGPVVGVLRRRRRRAGRARAGRRPAERRPWIALEGFGCAHYVLLLGIVLVAAGNQEGHRASLRRAHLRPGAHARRRRRGLPGRRRLVSPRPGPGALGAPCRGRGARVATVPLGSEVAAVAQLAVLVAVLAAALAGEGAVLRARPAPDPLSGA